MIELPDVIVAVCGLNEQNVVGMAEVLAQLREHPARVRPAATLLALSPVPTTQMLSPGRETVSFAHEQIDASTETDPLTLLRRRITDIQSQLLTPLQQEFIEEVWKRFPGLNEQDLFRQLPYDPMVPITGELQIARTSDLSRAYGDLADTIARARTGDAGLAHLRVKIEPRQ
jgi:hypothetical protein